MPKRPSSPSAPTATPASSSSSAESASAPPKDEEVVSSSQPRAKNPRRTFTKEQKCAILAEAQLCKRGDLGALLRRHGLYTATLSKWRQAVATPAPRGPGRPSKHDPHEQQIHELQQRIEQLEAQSRRSQGLLELQKKALALMEAASLLGAAS